ncbi:MAG: GSCFA domain-containing protein [Victivallaceae bacterium]
MKIMICDNIAMQTPVKMPESGIVRFGADAVICGVGSCFSENIVGFLHECGFGGAMNPTGIIYNAYSMRQTLTFAVKGKIFTTADFFEHGGLWHSREHHGAFSASNPVAAAEKANAVMTEFRRELKRAGLLIVTPSASVVYVERETGQIVANCHKVPNSRFQTRLLSQAENLEHLESAIALVHDFNPDCRIIFTLSPVRHYPGHLLLNSRSKANLLSAIRDCVERHSGHCAYFPAYEIMNDELRDYRFYKTDMLHPSEQATGYILGRFIETCGDAAARDKIAAAVKMLNMARHRSLHDKNNPEDRQK